MRSTGGAGGAVLADRHPEDVVAPAVLEAVPVAHEELVEDHARGLGGGLRLEARRGARDRLGAVREDREAEVEGRAAGADLQRLDRERQIGHLLGGAGGEVPAPDLRRAAARGQEVERPVRAPARAPVIGRVGDQGPRFRAVEAHQPDVAQALVGLEIHRSDDERRPGAVRRGLRVRDALHGHHVVDRERVRLGGGGAGRDRQKRNDGDEMTSHGTSRARNSGHRIS
jgi:hypothetical protein